jgi:cobalt/nickel transport protein
MKSTRRLWIALIVLALLTPLGLLVPQWLRAGSAWGEWSPQEVRERTGSVPEGMAREAEAHEAPLPDYSAPGGEPASPLGQSVWYVIAALSGMGAVVVLMLLLGRWLTRHERAADVDD